VSSLELKKRQEYYQTNRQEILEKKRAFYQKNKATLLAKNRKWRLEHIESLREADRLRNAKRREYIKQRNADYYKSHKVDPRRKERERRYQKKHPDKIRRKFYNSRMRLRFRLFDLYGYACTCCGEARLQFLVIDRIKGGGNRDRKLCGLRKMWQRMIVENDPTKYQTLCYNCNAGKAFNLENPGMCPHQVEALLLEKLEAA